MSVKTGLVSLFVIGALGATAHATQKADETRIESKLKKDSDLHDVRVKYDRVVTLTGKVASESDKVRAEQLANVAGVTRVDNQIEVSGDKAKDRIDDRAEAAKTRAQEQADAEKNRIDREAQQAKDHVDHREGSTTASPSVGDDVSDAWITAKLKTHYTTDGMFKDSAIHVDTDARGLVKLTGTVPTETAHVKALEVARITKGVREVRDELKIEPRH